MKELSSSRQTPTYNQHLFFHNFSNNITFLFFKQQFIQKTVLSFFSNFFLLIFQNKTLSRNIFFIVFFVRFYIFWNFSNTQKNLNLRWTIPHKLTWNHSTFVMFYDHKLLPFFSYSFLIPPTVAFKTSRFLNNFYIKWPIQNNGVKIQNFCKKIGL